MNTFQLLKSGTSFKKQDGKLSKMMKHFDQNNKKQEEAKTPDGDANDRMQIYHQIDSIIPALDDQISTLKSDLKNKTKKFTGDDDEKLRETLAEFKGKLKTLQNQRGDRLIKLQKMYKIKVQGE